MNLKESVIEIQSYLDMDRKPVGVKFLYTQEEFKNFDIAQRDRKVTYCNSVQLASKGKCMKLTRENQGCPNGAAALHFVDVAPPIASGVGRHKKNIYNDIETSKSVSDEMKFMDDQMYGVAVMPLDAFVEAPDVVVVISSSYNVMRMIQGNGFFYGYTDNLKTVGLQAVCQDLTTYPFNTGDINISLLCPGTRLVANWQPEEIGIGIPFAKWYKIVEGVKETINPFERNDKKEGIKKRLEENGLDASWIAFNSNYDDGSYSGGLVEVESC